MGGGPHLPGEGEPARNGMVRYSQCSSIPSFRIRAMLLAGGPAYPEIEAGSGRTCRRRDRMREIRGARSASEICGRLR